MSARPRGRPPKSLDPSDPSTRDRLLDAASDACVAVGPIYKEAKIPTITANSATEITRDNPSAYRVYPVADYQGAAIVLKRPGYNFRG